MTSGKIKVNLIINKFPFISSDIDFCSTVSQFGLKCPISAGPQTFSLTVQIPDEAPTVSYIAYIDSVQCHNIILTPCMNIGTLGPIIP